MRVLDAFHTSKVAAGSMNILNNPWNVVFFAGFIVYLFIRGIHARRTRSLATVHRQVDAMEKTLLPFVISTSLLLPPIYLFTPLLCFAAYQPPAFLPWFGLATMLLALWLFWRSHADLGRNWSVSLEVRKDQQLVRHGVYRGVRHPMYASIFLWCIAQGLLLPNWLAGWSSLVAFTPLYFLRTPREERMMCEFFGQEYRDYMSETGRLFPRFGRKKRSPHVADEPAAAE
jgi:protein-S-isoprenylcysteine O-methyltransferase Ste14